jgi:hypothetical protein
MCKKVIILDRIIGLYFSRQADRINPAFKPLPEEVPMVNLEFTTAEIGPTPLPNAIITRIPGCNHRIRPLTVNFRCVAELAERVRLFLKRMGMTCRKMLPYSPNLNLIERLWKFVKKTCLYSKYYAHFTDLKQAISDCLTKTHTT